MFSKHWDILHVYKSVVRSERYEVDRHADIQRGMFADSRQTYRHTFRQTQRQKQTRRDIHANRQKKYALISFACIDVYFYRIILFWRRDPSWLGRLVKSICYWRRWTLEFFDDVVFDWICIYIYVCNKSISIKKMLGLLEFWVYKEFLVQSLFWLTLKIIILVK